MRLLAIVFAFAITGCASVKKEAYYPPSPAAVVKDLDEASAAAKELDQYVSAEGKQAAQKLNNSLDGAVKSLYSYSVKVNELGEQIVKAQKDANYWREKHYQDLKIIWFWRLLAFSAVICVIVYLGLKTSWKFFL